MKKDFKKIKTNGGAAILISIIFFLFISLAIISGLVSLSVGEGASFSYGVQSGQGGFILENTSSITGNVYSAGSIIGSGNFIYGDAVSSGEAGLIDGIHTTGSAYAHTMQDSVVEKDAFYMVKTNTTCLLYTS